jgi:hypothetical protein
MNSAAHRAIPRGAPQSATTQREHILRLLTDARGAWVPAPEIMACAAQYNARIFELRRRSFTIENRTETDSETGARHSWFRLVSPSAPCALADSKAAHDAPISKSDDWYESATGKKRAADPSPDELPLLRSLLGGATR